MNHPAALSGTENEHVNSNSIQNRYGPCVTVVEAREVDCTDVIEALEMYADKLVELRQEKVDTVQALSTQKEIRDKILAVRSKFETIQNKVNRTDKENAFMEKAQGTLTQNVSKYLCLAKYANSEEDLDKARMAIAELEKARNHVLSEIAVYTDRRFKSEKELDERKKRSQRVSTDIVSPYKNACFEERPQPNRLPVRCSPLKTREASTQTRRYPQLKFFLGFDEVSHKYYFRF